MNSLSKCIVAVGCLLAAHNRTPHRILRPSWLPSCPGWFEDHLGLRDERDEVSSLGGDARLPDHGAPATVHRRTLADDLGPKRGRGKEICLRLDGRGAGSLRQVERCSASAEGVSEGHEGPTVQDGRLGTELLPDEQLGGEALRGGTEEVDAEQFRER